MAKESVVYSTSDKSGAATRRDVSPKAEVIVQGDGNSSKGSFSPLEPRLYVVRQGMRYPITDSRSFREAGFDPSAVKVIPDAELQKIPVARNLELAPGEQIVLDLDYFLGAGHYMTTWGVMRKTASGAHIDATTRTRTITMFGGFHGGVNIVFWDAQKFPVGMSETQTFGVDGTWIGRSDRTDYWSMDLSQDWATRTTGMTIFEFWNPWSLQDTVRKLVDTVRPLVEIVQAVANIGGGSKSSN
jgi:hypothetical protein